MKKHPERKRNRLQDYNYSQDGLYFVTICVQDREIFFGRIKDERIFLNNAGKIVEKCWLDIPLHFPFVVLDEFVIMPNHVHGILAIQNTVDCTVGNTHACSSVIYFSYSNKRLNAGIRNTTILTFRISPT